MTPLARRRTIHTRCFGRFLPAGLAAVVALLGALLIAAEHESAAGETAAWKSAGATDAVADDADDVAFWIHPTDPAKSLIIGTNKAKAPTGALVVYDLSGRALQTIDNLDRPNNVDVRQRVVLEGGSVDLAAVTERRKHAVRLYTIDAQTRRLNPRGVSPVFEGEDGPRAEPMGIALYHRPRDGALFVVLSRKEGPADGYLWQYRVQADGVLRLVRKFGRFSGTGEIEAIVVDDANDVLYYADENAGIRKYHADPDHPDAAR
jgi:3-phytase